MRLPAGASQGSAQHTCLPPRALAGCGCQLARQRRGASLTARPSCSPRDVPACQTVRAIAAHASSTRASSSLPPPTAPPPSSRSPPLPLSSPSLAPCQGEDSTSSANQCLLKVAAFAGQLGKYDHAISIFEVRLITALPPERMLPWPPGLTCLACMARRALPPYGLALDLRRKLPRQLWTTTCSSGQSRTTSSAPCSASSPRATRPHLRRRALFRCGYRAASCCCGALRCCAD